MASRTAMRGPGVGCQIDNARVNGAGTSVMRHNGFAKYIDWVRHSRIDQHSRLGDGKDMQARRKCFITYHHADDGAVAHFVRTFDHAGDVFIVRRLGEMPDDIVDSVDTDYVMRRIREDYIRDSTVTLVLAGRCTWARRYVDWEIQASLRQPANALPNGLLGIKLPGFSQWPERLSKNMAEGGYAGWIDYPISLQNLQHAIEWAFGRRTTHASKIVNPRDRFSYNRTCT